MELIKGKQYRFKHEAQENPRPLAYIGKNWSGNGYWHQFTKVGENKVWSELSDESLYLVEPIPTTEQGTQEDGKHLYG